MRGRALVAVGLCITIAGLLLTGSAVRSALGTVPVPVAARDLEAFSRVDPSLIRIEQVPRAALHELTLLDPQELVGRVSLVSLYAGEPFLQGKLVCKSDLSRISVRLDGTTRGFTLPVGAGTAWGQVVEEGDLVDVVWVCPEARGLEAFAVTILQRVPVVATIRAPGSATRAGDTTAVVLAVEPLAAAGLALAVNSGKLHLVILGLEAGGYSDRGPVTVIDLLGPGLGGNANGEDWIWDPGR